MRVVLDVILECYAVVAFQILTAAYLMLSISRSFGQRYGNRGPGTPLLLIHGYMNNPAVFWPLIARLRKLGMKEVHVVTLAPPWGSIQHFASQISEAVERIIGKRGSERVDILAHSMGGIAVAHYLKFLRGSNRTRKFLAAGTPFRGTHLAWLGTGICAFQMCPRSRFIRMLDFKAEDVPSTSVYCLRAGFDEYVLPNRSAFLGLPAADMRFKGLGHGGLLLSKISALRIAEVLAL
jgi:triacylglycerol lipase